MTKKLTLVWVLMLSLATAAQTEESSVNRGRVMWSAFECATYAEMARDKKEQDRLSKVGYETGKKFLGDVANKTVLNEEIKNAPMAVRWRLSGPSIDFIIGRIFESATIDAFDSVTKEDSRGLPLIDPSKWVTDRELMISIAKTRFLYANCAIVQ